MHLESDAAVHADGLSTTKPLPHCHQWFSVWQCHPALSRSSHADCIKASLPAVGSYTDYRLTIDGQPCLIVEAKRLGVIGPLPKTIQRPEYANSFLFTNYGYEMKSLLEQCQAYCVQCGIPYALATTGEVWIILVGFKNGVEWGKLRSFVFHSLEDIYHRFGDFYGLVSREAIKNNSLEEKFGSMMLIKPGIAIRPRMVVPKV